MAGWLDGGRKNLRSAFDDWRAQCARMGVGAQDGPSTSAIHCICSTTPGRRRRGGAPQLRPAQELTPGALLAGAPFSMKRFFLCSLAATLLTASAPAIASASEAEAEAPRRSMSSFGAKLGANLFRQPGGSPPICCGERDGWSALGPQIAITFGWNIGEHLRISTEAAYAFLVAEDTGRHEDLTMHAIDGTLAMEGVVSWGFRGGFVAVFGHARGSAMAGAFENDFSQVRLQALARVGYEAQLAGRFALGPELSAGLDLPGFFAPVGSLLLVGRWSL